MTDLDPRIPALWADFERRIKALEATQQLSASTVGDTDEDAVAVDEVVADASIVNDALPDMQDAVASANDGVSQLDARLAAADAELDARLELADTNLAEARDELEEAQGQIRDAFGQEIEGLSDRIDQIVVGADGVLLLYSEDAPTSDDKAPAGSTWWMINESKGIVGQWQQVGTDDAPVWEPRPIESDLIANLDVGKLSAGQAAIAQVVAQKIAASTASIQTVNVGNLFVTQGATMPQAVIDYLFANVVTAKKITTDMLDVNSFNGVTITGVAVAGGSLSTIKDPNSPFGGTIRIANSVVEARNSSAGYPHYTQLFATQDGALSIYSAIALNAGGTSTRQVTTRFATAPSQFPWSSVEPIMGISTSQPVEFQRVYTGNVYVGPSGGSAATASITSDGVYKGADYRLPDGTTILTGFLRMNIPTTTGTSGQTLATGAVTQLSNMVRHSDSIRADVGSWLQSYSGNSVQLKPGVYLITTNFVTTTRVSSRTFLSIFRDGTEIQRTPGSSEDQFSGVVTIAVAAGATTSIDMRFYQASGANMYAQRGDLNITKIG